jgi:uncharacterized membrane protein
MRDLTHYIAAIAFLAAATSMLVYARRHRTHRPFWVVMAGVFLLFTLLKVVPLVPESSNAARSVSQAAGVYSERRAVQRLAVGVICLTAAVGLGAILTYARPSGRQMVPLLGAAAVIAFAAIRWTSLHSVDALNEKLPWLVVAVELSCAITSGLAPHWRPEKASRRPRRKAAR